MFILYESIDVNKDYNKRMNILNGVFATISLNLVNPYYAKFAERLGASDFQIAYLTSLPHFISILAFIPGALLIESLSNKQKTIGSTMLVHKFFFLFIAIVPFLNINQASAFITLVGLMNLPGSIATMGYQSSMADVFSIEDRKRAMGLRSRYSAFVGIVITFLSGRILSSFSTSNEIAIKIYQVFFLLAFFMALGEVIFFFKLKGFENTKRINYKAFKALKDVLREIPKNKSFMIFTFASMFFHIGWIGAQPLFSIYMIKTLGANEIWLAATSIASGFSSVCAYTKWPGFAEKKGTNVALTIAILGMGVTPILYALSSKMYMLVLFNILIGVSIAGTVLLLFNLLLEIIPKENRTIYIAVYNTLIAIVSGISPILGVKLMNLTSMTIALFAVAAIRLVSSIFFYKISERV